MLSKRVLSLSITFLLGLSACGSKDNSFLARHSSKKDVSAATKVGSDDSSAELITKDISANISMPVEDLVEAGEQLIAPHTFMVADRIFSMVLKKDPNHKKALFYKAFLKRFMVFEGVLTGVKPLVAKSGADKLEEFELSIKKLPDSPVKSFLTASHKGMKSAGDVQDLLVDYVDAVAEFRDFARDHANDNFEITLNMNLKTFESELMERAKNSCEVLQNDPEAVRVTCDLSQVAKVKLNSADLMVLRQMAGAEIVLWSIYTAYTIDGIEEVAKKIEGRDLSNEEFNQILAQHPKLGLLRKDHRLGSLIDLGVDFSKSVKWAQKYQKQLCPQGLANADKIQRRGYLVEKGLCLELNSETDKLLALLDAALIGPVYHDLLNLKGEMVNVKIDPFATLRAPPVDIRHMISGQFGKCENGKSVIADKTLGGVFPDGNAEEFVSSCKE